MAKVNCLARLFAQTAQKILYPTRIVGAENFKDFTGGIIISNHYVSTPDGVIIFNNFFKTYFNSLVKEESFKTKIGNWFLTGIGCIPVKRGKPDIDAYKKVMHVLRSGENILIFPEGTRNRGDDKVLGPFKNGTAVFAMRAHCEILPMMYYRRHRVFHRNILLVGKPVNLEKLGFTRTEDERATEYLYETMLSLREEVNRIAGEKKLCG